MLLMFVLVHEQRAEWGFEHRTHKGKLTWGMTGYGHALVPSWVGHNAGCISHVGAVCSERAENSHCPVVMAFFLGRGVAL